MHALESTDLVRRIFDRIAQGDPLALTDAMADDFHWIFPGSWSWSGSWGPKHVTLDTLLRPLRSQFDSYRLRADSIIGAGDQVVVQARADAVTKRGQRYDQVYCFIFTVRHGQLAQVIEYCDTALVERVLVLPDRPSRQ